MRITVHVADRSFEIDIEKLPHQETIDHVVVDGERVDIAIAPDWLKQFSKCLIVGNRSYQVEFELDRQGLPKTVWAVGQSVDVALDFPGKGKLKRPEMAGLWGEGNQIRAPLPGKVIGIRAKPGDRVTAGQPLCLLEAMKMENELHSPRDGIVKEILVEEGELVELDQVLITLE
jgi:biotin carboxyl carrier protein